MRFVPSAILAFFVLAPPDPVLNPRTARSPALSSSPLAKWRPGSSRKTAKPDASRTDREGMLLKYAKLKAVALWADNTAAIALGFVTSDGAKWDFVKSDGQPYATRLDLLFPAGNCFHAMLLQDGEIPTMATSTDGKTWTPRKPICDDKKVIRHDAHLRRFAQGGDRLVVVGDYGARLVRVANEEKFVHVLKRARQGYAHRCATTVTASSSAAASRLSACAAKTVFEWTDRTVGEEGEHINSMISTVTSVAIERGAIACRRQMGPHPQHRRPHRRRLRQWRVRRLPLARQASTFHGRHPLGENP
ncbi:MAG: hypothetical protein U0744_20220 [Gemmataceae bacterium]